MNCELCQRQLVLVEAPESPPPELAAHLAGCLDCREYQRQLLQIEHNVRLLPVPASSPQAFLTQKLKLTPPPASHPAAATAPPAPARQAPATLPMPSSRSRWLVNIAGGLAAAAILIACGIFLGNLMSALLGPEDRNQAQVEPDKKAPPPKKPGPEPKGTDKKVIPDRKAPALNPLVARLLESDLSLAEGRDESERVEQLAKLAGALHSESRPLAKASAARELETVARLYGKVIREGVVARARKLPHDQRRETLEAIARDLAQASKDARELAHTASPAAATHLLALADAARDGDAQLRSIMGEDTE